MERALLHPCISVLSAFSDSSQTREQGKGRACNLPEVTQLQEGELRLQLQASVLQRPWLGAWGLPGVMGRW